MKKAMEHTQSKELGKKKNEDNVIYSFGISVICKFPCVMSEEKYSNMNKCDIWDWKKEDN